MVHTQKTVSFLLLLSFIYTVNSTTTTKSTIKSKLKDYIHQQKLDKVHVKELIDQFVNEELEKLSEIELRLDNILKNLNKKPEKQVKPEENSTKTEKVFLESDTISSIAEKFDTLRLEESVFYSNQKEINQKQKMNLIEMKNKMTTFNSSYMSKKFLFGIFESHVYNNFGSFKTNNGEEKYGVILPSQTVLAFNVYNYRRISQCSKV